MKLNSRIIRQIILLLTIVFTALIVTIQFAVQRGQDLNFDQQNYHIAVPFLLAHGTFWTSVVPCDIQTFFNPYVLQAQFFALTHLGPVDFSIALAAVQSLAFMIAGLICYDIAKPQASWPALIVCLLGYALCILAPGPLSEVGTTFIDLLMSIPILAAYTLLLTRGRWLKPFAACALAGLLLGAAASLKLTSAIFVIAAFGFFITGPDCMMARLKYLGTYGCSAVLSFALVGGPWYLEVWRHFKNPFFPYYNNIFRSPDYPPVAFTDARWLMHPLGFLHYPLYLLLSTHPADGSTPSVSAEVPFQDPRWIFSLYGVLIFIAILLVALIAKPGWAKARLREPATGLLFTFAFAFFISYEKFNIQRYIVALDILGGAIILALFMSIRPVSLRILLLAGVVVFSFKMMKLPDWGHVAWQPYWTTISPKALDFGGPALVFLLENPDSDIVTSLPASTRYVAMNGEYDLRAENDTDLTRQLKKLLSARPYLQLKSVDYGTVSAIATVTLASYGLRVSNRCQPDVLSGRLFRICNIIRSQT